MYSPFSPTRPIIFENPQRPLNNYKLRVVVSSLVSNTYKESLLALAKTLFGSYIFALEVGKKTEKLHFHGALSMDSARRDTVAVQLKKFLQFDPNIKKLTNSHWSLTLDEEPDTWHRYVCYCVKEQNIICSSFSEKEIEIMYSEYQSEADKIKTVQRSVINSKQRKACVDRDTHFQNIVNKIEKENLLKESTDDEEYEVDPRFVTDPSDNLHKSYYRTTPQCETGRQLKIMTNLVIDQFNTGDIYYSLSQLTPIINRLMSRYYPGYWKKQLAAKLINQLIISN